MDMYGLSTTDFFRIDDLLDFSNDENLSSSAAQPELNGQQRLPSSENTSSTAGHSDANAFNFNHCAFDFTDGLCVPSEDVAELEWLSTFADDSFTDFSTNSVAGAVSFRSDTSFQGRSRSKHSGQIATNGSWRSSPESDIPIGEKRKIKTESTKKRENSSRVARERSSSKTGSEKVARRCTHCASEKRPQWRTGPLGPKTLCNACGVRYKSGRLVPEYRPAASPTFVLTQHSNSHRKVLELRRQKEQLHQHQQQQLEEEQQQQQVYGHHQQRGFEVC